MPSPQPAPMSDPLPGAADAPEPSSETALGRPPADSGLGSRPSAVRASGACPPADPTFGARPWSGPASGGPVSAGPASALRLRGRVFGPGDFAIMAVVNRTPDSFFDRGSTFGFTAAVDAASRLIEEGADIVDIGGVKAGPGTAVDPDEEIRRVAEVVAAVRERHPDVIISVDTWRAEVAKVVAEAGADLLNDTWGGVDGGLAEVAAAYGTGLVCAHAGRVEPRTRPHRIAYDDVMADVIGYTTALAERAVAAGVRADGILIDPAHDFGKNTWHSLEVSRRLAEMTATGWPVLVAVSNKDFVGETLGGLPVKERHAGTLATLAVSALQGARVFRVHDAASARTALAVVTRLRDA